ncbi:restriction endonuclease subunit S domain-containing protein [Psychrosphaera aestuarii]|uniref:hypothetical protein n=1 Tax=Psychrosphaera aestuarii TaxID=1266052 RepID=UPI001FD21B5A|nr:hypothetical protein [Psychrosphaera aestuarii]
MSFDIREHNLPLPKGWRYKKISDVATVNANTIRKKDAPDEIYYIDISSVSNGSFEPPKHMIYADAPSRAKRIVKKNDFIMSTVRPNLKQYVFLDEVHENWIASTGFVVVSAIATGTEWYLYSVITSELFNEHLVRVADGGTYPAFNPKEIEDAVIFWPDKDSLRVINDLAFNLNTKQKNNTQTSQTLEQIAQAIFKSWFVDFDPVKAKIEALAAGGSADDAELAAMRVISAKTLDELSGLKASNFEAFNKLAQTASLFPAAMQDSELGGIPEGWDVVRIGDIVKRLKPNKRYSKKQVEPHGKTPVYEQGASILLGFHNDDAGFEANPKDPIFIFGDHTCITHLSCSSFDISSNVIPLKGSVRPTIWTYFAIQGKQEFQEYRRHWSEFIIKDIVLPSKKLAESYTELVTTKYLMIESLRRESKQLELLRDALLPKLLSGEIDLASEVVA